MKKLLASALLAQAMLMLLSIFVDGGESIKGVFAAGMWSGMMLLSVAASYFVASAE
jgi:hypothetical protein